VQEKGRKRAFLFFNYLEFFGFILFRGIRGIVIFLTMGAAPGQDKSTMPDLLKPRKFVPRREGRKIFWRMVQLP
jgi:hypothetical protein